MILRRDSWTAKVIRGQPDGVRLALNDSNLQGQGIRQGFLH